jgi:hypothetical protein
MTGHIRIVALLTLLSFMLSLPGCTRLVRHSVDAAPLKPDQKIEAVILRDGTRIDFVNNSGRLERESEVVTGTVAESQNTSDTAIEIPLADIQYVAYRQTDTGKTVIVAILGTVAVGIVLAALVIASIADDMTD